MSTIKHEYAYTKLGDAPNFYHHATCTCGWRSKRGRGHVERCRRDFDEHFRAVYLPDFVDGECSWCEERSTKCIQFFAHLSYVRLCPDCIKRFHHRNIEIGKAERSARYQERTSVAV
jgi:hypothetical protein